MPATAKNGILYKWANLNGKTRGKHPNCPSCGHRMKRLYIKDQFCKTARWVGVGWLCLSCGNVKLGDA